MREQVVDRVLRSRWDRSSAPVAVTSLARVGDDVGVIAEAVRNVLPALVGSALTIVLTIVGLAVLDWRLALAGLCAVPIQIPRCAGTCACRRRSTPASARPAAGARSSCSSRSTVSRPSAPSVSPTRTTSAVAARSRDAMGFAFAPYGCDALLRTLNLAEFVGPTAILITGFLLVRAGTVSIGAATAAALFFVRLFDPINVLLGLFDEAQNAAPALPASSASRRCRRRRSQTSRRTRATDGAGERRDARLRRGHEVLRDISIEIAPGERVALVGVSGAGKTTLAKLLAGIHEPTIGTILLGGMRIDELGPAVTGRVVALITQEVHVFAGTLAEDLRLVRPDATDDELWQALEIAGALVWVEGAGRWPAGPSSAMGGIASPPPRPSSSRSRGSCSPTRRLRSSTRRQPKQAAPVRACSRRRQRGCSAAHSHSSSRIASRRPRAPTASSCSTPAGCRDRHARRADAGGTYAELWAAWSDQR